MLKDGYLQTTGTVVRGDVEGKSAQTIFIDTGSKVAGSVEAVRAVQFYVFNSTVGEDIEPEKIGEAVQICGNTVRKGNIEVRGSGYDVLIGDPQAVGCRGNVVKRGDIKVARNFSLVEFVLRGNTVKRGDLEVTNNTGPTPKFVQDNTGGGRIKCSGNTLLTVERQRRLGPRGRPVRGLLGQAVNGLSDPRAPGFSRLRKDGIPVQNVLASLSRSERLPAAAGCDDLRVVHREAGALQALDVVDLGAVDEGKALGVDQQADAAVLVDLVTVALLVECERVLEARATAAADRRPAAPPRASAWPFMSSLTFVRRCR